MANESAPFRARRGQVIEAQEFLRDLYSYQGGIDGKINRDMRSALRKFQRVQSLKVSGTLNWETYINIQVAIIENSGPAPFFEEIGQIDSYEIPYRAQYGNAPYAADASQMIKSGSLFYSFDNKSDSLLIAAIFFLLSAVLIAGIIF